MKVKIGDLTVSQLWKLTQPVDCKDCKVKEITRCDEFHCALNVVYGDLKREIEIEDVPK